METQESSECRVSRGGLLIVWQKYVKILINGLTDVGPLRVPGWVPRLETIDDMAQ